MLPVMLVLRTAASLGCAWCEQPVGLQNAWAVLEQAAGLCAVLPAQPLCTPPSSTNVCLMTHGPEMTKMQELNLQSASLPPPSKKKTTKKKNLELKFLMAEAHGNAPRLAGAAVHGRAEEVAVTLPGVTQGGSRSMIPAWESSLAMPALFW